ncbi:hypothetical protein ACWWJF_15675 [Symbiopectobacterium sp. Eva_TO]
MYSAGHRKSGSVTAR